MAIKFQTPWWLWPNLLNLDSPILALIWQEQFARIAGVNLTISERILLFCCTWLIYCADRMLDVLKSNTKAETGRHKIHQKGQRVWIVISAILLITALFLAFNHLNNLAWMAGGIVFGLTTIHFAATHWLPILRIRIWPKEWHVGIVFSMGCALQVWSLKPDAWLNLILPTLSFGALCAISCSHITVWEVVTADRHNSDSLINAHYRFVNRLSWFDIGLGVLCLVLAVIFNPTEIQKAFIAVAISAFALAWIHDRHNQFSTNLLRTFADIGLYTPILLFLF